MFENLRRIRQDKSIKAKEISEKLGLKTEGAYYKKETGKVPFTLEEGKIIADIFKMPIDKIFFTNELSCKDNKKRRKNNGNQHM